MKKSFLALSILATALSTLPAAQFVGVNSNNELFGFDSSDPLTPLFSNLITGLVQSDGVTSDPFGTILNLAFDPVSGLHFGLDGNANFYSITLAGTASLIDSSFSPSGFDAGFAYDPFSDRFVFASDDAENVLISRTGNRIANPALIYASGDANASSTPAVFGLGIDPVFGEAYFVDASLGILSRAVDPAFSELFTVGSLGTAFTPFGALSVDEDGNLFGSFSTDGLTSALYSINTTSGAASLIGNFGTGVGTFAAIPEPSVVALLTLCAAGALFFRRRSRRSPSIS